MAQLLDPINAGCPSGRIRADAGLYPVPDFGQLLCAIRQGWASDLKREGTRLPQRSPLYPQEYRQAWIWRISCLAIR